MDTLVRDARIALRSLARTPAFTATAALTLALGIGAVTTAASVVHSLLLRPLPYSEPGRVVVVWERPPAGRERNQVSPPNFADWAAEARSFEAIGASLGEEFSLTGDGEPDRLPGQRVTPGLFDVLGVEARQGRRLRAGDGPGGARVVVLSDGLWRSRFGADPAAVGRTLRLDDEPHEIVGVMPPGFRLPGAERSPWAESALWAPLERDPRAGSRGAHSMVVLARLRRGVEVAHAREEMDAIAARLARAHPDTSHGWGATVVPLHDQVVAEARRPLLVLSGALAFVLLIACANVSHMLLSRAAHREGEMAVRAALGASRARLARQLLTEAGVLWLFGAASGLLLAAWALEALRRAAPAALPPLHELGMSPPAAAGGLAASLAVTLAFGAAPALAAARRGRERLQGGRGVAGGRSLTRALVVSEVALSLVLLAGAGLLLRSWQRLSAVQPGFDPEDVLTFRVSAPPGRYPTGALRAPFYDDVLSRLRALPEVVSAGAIGDAPLTGGEGFWRMYFQIEGEPPSREAEGHDAYVRWVTPGYFETLRIPRLRGRAFDERDRADAPPVVIVDRTLARRYFGAQDPVGRRLQVSVGWPRAWREIVGVVGEVRQTALEQGPAEHVYLPHAQSGRWLPHMTVALRAPAAAGLAEAVRRAVWSFDPDTPVYGLEPMDRLVTRSAAARRFQTSLLALFAAVALGLAAVGLYGTLAESVARRRREVGIRMAVGAGRADVVWLVVRQGMALALAGAALGLAGAGALARLLASLLFEVRPTDPAAHAAAALTLLGVAFLASYVPARRAAGLDPVRVLRQD